MKCTKCHLYDTKITKKIKEMKREENGAIQNCYLFCFMFLMLQFYFVSYLVTVSYLVQTDLEYSM